MGKESRVSSINGAGKLVIHTQRNESEYPTVKKNCLCHPILGTKMFATFIDNNVAMRELFGGISQFTAMVDLEGIMLY